MSGAYEFMISMLPGNTYYGNNNGRGDVFINYNQLNYNFEIKAIKKFEIGSAATAMIDNSWKKDINTTLSSAFISLLTSILELFPKNEKLKQEILGLTDSPRIMLGSNKSRNASTFIDKSSGKQIIYTIDEITHNVMQKLYSCVKSEINKDDFNLKIRRFIKKFVLEIYTKIIPNYEHDKNINIVQRVEIEQLYDELINNQFNCFDDNSYIFNGISAVKNHNAERGKCYQSDEMYCRFCILFFRAYLNKVSSLVYFVDDKDFWLVVRNTDTDDELLEKLFFLYADVHDKKLSVQRSGLRILPNFNYIIKNEK